MKLRTLALTTLMATAPLAGHAAESAKNIGIGLVGGTEGTGIALG